jgi:hypothetical protein
LLNFGTASKLTLDLKAPGLLNTSISIMPLFGTIFFVMLYPLPETGRYTLIKGGNTRLLAFKALYRETSDTKFAAIDCIVEAWEGELNRTQAVISHLIENEARGFFNASKKSSSSE